jgi:Ca2+-transporting ATPase
MAGGVVMEGPVFRLLDDSQMLKIVPCLQVLARSSPEDKKILVEKLRTLGEIVGVTGRFVNDAVRKFLQFQISTNVTVIVITFVNCRRVQLQDLGSFCRSASMDQYYHGYIHCALSLATDPAYVRRFIRHAFVNFSLRVLFSKNPYPHSGYGCRYGL